MITLAGTPVIETERLRLRAPAGRDFPLFAAYAASERSRFTGGPQSRELAWRAFGHMIGHWVLRGYGMFAVETHEGQLIATLGPWFPEGWPEPELGWSVLSADAEGKGYAFEAVTAARNFAYGTLGWQTAVSLIDPENIRSQALARRLGARADGTYEHERFGTMHIWRHPSPAEIGAAG